MDKVLLCYVALPCTQHVQNLINFLSITNVSHPACTAFTEGYGLFIYKDTLELEDIDYETEWVINDEDALTVLTLFATKDFNGICTYLNTLPGRPFNVYINSNYFT